MLARLAVLALASFLASCSSVSVPLFEAQGEMAPIEGLGSGLDSVSYSGPARPQDRISRAHVSVLFLGGLRSFDVEQWDPVQDQTMLGVDLSWVGSGIPIGFEVGAAASYSQEDMPVLGNQFTFTGSSWDAHGGLRIEWNPEDGPLIVTCGIGLGYLDAEFKSESMGTEVSDSDWSLGYYVRLGVLLQLSAFTIGADLRVFQGTPMSLYDTDVDANYVQAALAAGLRF